MAATAETTDWKERCSSLEMSLINFQTQATKIRRVLAEKMTELEHKAEIAEQRAEKAEQKNKLLEQQLSVVNLQPAESEKRLQELEASLQEKDKLVTTLQQNIELQNKQREADIKTVEEKSSKIKEWVSKKLQEMEVHNTQLKLENDTLKEQLNLLRSRLQALPSGIAKHIYRTSIQKSDLSGQAQEPSGPPKIPKRPSSVVMQSLQKELKELREPDDNSDVTLDVTTDESPPTEDAMEDSDFDPMYQEVDDNHESKYEPKRVAPPQIRIERKVFHTSHKQQPSSVISSSNGSEEFMNSRQHLRMSSEDQHGAHVSSVHTLSSRSISAAHTDRSAPPNTPTLPLYTFTSGSQIVNALTTLPRKKKEHNTKFFPFKDEKMLIREQNLSGVKAAYRMSMDPSHTRSATPPTPPMRRLPSWESRIYAVARTGMWLPDTAYDREHRLSAEQMADQSHAQEMYSDISVPVFTTVKGKATQIRSTPFSGDSSSDSSDNEDSHIVMTESKPVTTVAGPSGFQTTTSVTVRTQVNQSSSGATKRGVSTHSVGSETSSDYAVPPDDESIVSDTSDNSEPEHKLLKCTTSQNLKKNSLEYSGYLTKLGGKVKSWKRRWFVLKNGDLFYYKSASDISRKPQGCILLNGQTQIIKSSGSCTFEITSAKHTYYLGAESISDMEQWIRVLRNLLRKKVADIVIQQTNAKEVMKGLVIKAHQGKIRRSWCMLIGKHLIFYKSQLDKTPLCQINMLEARVEDIDSGSDTEGDDSDDSSSAAASFTIAVWPYQKGPTYLMLPTKHTKDCWLYHLTVASGGGMANIGTEYERLISKLMEDDGDPSSLYWKHPLLLHSKEFVRQPLTTLPSEQLQHKALDVSKSCHLFMNVAVDSPGVDYHVSLAQNIIHTCLRHPQLQNEVYCQLIKQTSRHPTQHKTSVPNFLICGTQPWFFCEGNPASPASSMVDLSDSKLNPVTYVLVQGWQLLSMCVSVFLPKQSILWYLKAHLHRNADPRTEVGKYAVFCQRVLDRAVQNGCRDARPSRMEVLSILLRNPFHHSQPISIPVHFLNSEYQVVSFDGSTTVDEFLSSLNKSVGMRETSQSGFALFTDDPTDQQIEHSLKGHLKICDVISKWEQSYQEQGLRVDPNRTIRLIYKNRLYFKSRSKCETEKERLLLCYQANENIMNGHFPVNKDLAMVLASLMAQIEFGDYKRGDSMLSTSVGSRNTPPSLHHTPEEVMSKFFPKHFLSSCEQDSKLIEELLIDKWKTLKGRSLVECVRIYQTVVKKWQYFGAKLFSVKVKFGDPGMVWLAVQEDNISLLDYSSLKTVSSYSYKDVVTFGGCREDFMLTVTLYMEVSPQQYEKRTDRLLFVMSKPKIIEITLLLAAYINAQVTSPARLLLSASHPQELPASSSANLNN